MVAHKSMINDIPQRFDKAFLCWFRERTEDTWRNYRVRTFKAFETSRVGGSDWQQGTHWLNGLSEQEIATIEQYYHVRFPPDYHLFLHELHCVDRPLVGAKFVDDNIMMPITTPSLYNWQTDTKIIQDIYEWLVKGLLFDVQWNNLWQQSWGVKPTTLEAQETRLRELVNAAPKLVPIFGHRFLLTEPCKVGNPILSIYQSDMIIYADNLHSYFLAEFGSLVGVGEAISYQPVPQRRATYQTIPFWGEFLS